MAFIKSLGEKALGNLDFLEDIISNANLNMHRKLNAVWIKPKHLKASI